MLSKSFEIYAQDHGTSKGRPSLISDLTTFFILELFPHLFLAGSRGYPRPRGKFFLS
jgi:hypothetical protein